MDLKDVRLTGSSGTKLRLSFLTGNEIRQFRNANRLRTGFFSLLFWKFVDCDRSHDIVIDMVTVKVLIHIVCLTNRMFYSSLFRFVLMKDSGKVFDLYFLSNKMPMISETCSLTGF